MLEILLEAQGSREMKIYYCSLCPFWSKFQRRIIQHEEDYHGGAVSPLKANQNGNVEVHPREGPARGLLLPPPHKVAAFIHGITADGPRALRQNKCNNSDESLNGSNKYYVSRPLTASSSSSSSKLSSSASPRAKKRAPNKLKKKPGRPKSKKVNNNNNNKSPGISCSHCEYTALNKTGMIKHSRMHKTTKKFKCSQCPYWSKFEGRISNHEHYCHN